MKKQRFLSQKPVTGKSAGYATATEDGGMAKDYANLIEVTTETGHIQDAYYFVEKSNADAFIKSLK